VLTGVSRSALTGWLTSAVLELPGLSGFSGVVGLFVLCVVCPLFYSKLSGQLFCRCVLIVSSSGLSVLELAVVLWSLFYLSRESRLSGQSRPAVL
jgi:hypothetical protein